jgi:uncharacterized protein CbrC (UPF0167 family)
VLRIVLFRPDSGNTHTPSRECACCGSRYPVKRIGMRLLDDDAMEGDVCPECVLAGPAGAAAKVRGRVRPRGESEGGAVDGVDRSSWVRRMERRARLLEETPAFSLAARQAAVRETQERR